MDDKTTKACLREAIGELRHLIIEHHSYDVMKFEHCTCPVCTQPRWDAVLNAAAKLQKAGDEQPAPPEPEELKALASATCCAAPPELVEALKEINRHIEVLEIDGRLGMSGSIVAARKQQELLVAALCEAQHNTQFSGGAAPSAATQS
jgi:hypothetical protein